MNLKRILFSLLLSISLTANASTVKDTYVEVLDIIKLHCKPGQYFNPHNKQLIITNLDSPIVGLCETDEEDFFNIYIDSGFWLSITTDMRFELMAHEMEHCLFFRKHVDNDKNFMYYQLRNLTKEETTQQLIDNLNQDCGNGK